MFIRRFLGNLKRRLDIQARAGSPVLAWKDRGGDDARQILGHIDGVGLTGLINVMRSPMNSSRTFEPIEDQDLQEILNFSKQELRRFLEQAGTPAGKYNAYSDRLLAVCLVQGAAQHFVDSRPDLRRDWVVEVPLHKIDEKGYRVNSDGEVTTGVKDIDVVFFFRHDSDVSIPSRNHCKKSIEHNLTAFGRRRFDFMKKGVRLEALGLGADANPTHLVQSYLAKTSHGRDYLSKKSVIGLFPSSIFGHTLWASHRKKEQPV